MENTANNQQLAIEEETVYQMLSSLSEEARSKVLARLQNNIENMDFSEQETSEQTYESIDRFLFERKSEDGSLPCPRCGCLHTVKYGFARGKQRFKCCGCGRTFVLTTNTILYYTHKDLATWKSFIDCLVEKQSLRRSAYLCHIDTRTAFFWRHKILDTLRRMMEEVTLNGVVEADETFQLLSFKGNRKKEEAGILRKSRKRGGTASKPGLSQDLVCVPVGINLDGLSIGKVANLGKPGLDDLRNVLGGKVAEESIFVTDSLRSYVQLSAEMGLYHYPIKPGRRKNGTFNIQKVNAYHTWFKNLINQRFRGVSTKHLNNYIVYHNFVDYSNGTIDEKKILLTDFSLAVPMDVRTREIFRRDPIPVLDKAA